MHQIGMIIKTWPVAFLFTAFATATMPAQEPQKSHAPVTYRYGKGISESDLASVVRGTEKRGCPVKLDNSGRPLTVTATTMGKSASFREPIDAAGWVLDRCTSVSTWPVKLLVGPGLNKADVASVVRVLEKEGCSVTVEDDFIPGTITAQVKGSSWGGDEPVDAGLWARDLCKGY